MKPAVQSFLPALRRQIALAGLLVPALKEQYGLHHRVDAAAAGTGIGHRVGRLGGTRLLASLLVLLAAGWFAPAASATNTTCGAATGQGADGPSDYPTYCWIDFTGYNNTTATSAGGQAFVVTLPGGSTLSFTLTVSGGALKGVTVPTWTGAAFGQAAFTGVPNDPALYQTTNTSTTTVTLSNLVLTVGTGTVPYAIVGADAESTNSGESLSFTTNGNAWTLLSSMQNGTSTTFPTLAGVGTTTVTETGVNGTVGAYAFATQGSPTTISSTMVGSGLQGIAFAVKFHAVDFAITSTPSGSFAAGGTGTYTLGVTSNGPDTYSPTDTVTVTDTLPTGLTYNPSGSGGSGWTCGVAGQVVTCTVSNVTLASGGTLPNIVVNVTVANTIATTVTNTATVASNPNLDFNTANNTATNATTIVEPNLTTSTKDVVNTGGGDAIVGSTLQYTITLTESNGAVAANVSVTDDVPAKLSNFTVTTVPTGATNSSTSTGGTNGDGLLNITGITVPASGSVTIVFTAQVASGTANCTTINNTATITNPNGATTSITPSAPTVIVAQSSCAASGNKILYLYDNTGGTTPAYTNLLNRVVQTKNTTNGNTITITGGSNHTWTMTPGVASNSARNLVLTAGTVTVTLIEQATGNFTNTNRGTTVSLLNNGTVVATSGSINVKNGPTAVTYTITIPATTVLAGNALGLQFNNNGSGALGESIAVSQKTAAQGNSTITFATSTVISIGSGNVFAYNAVYPATTTQAMYSPGNIVYICAVATDPFGSYDDTSATLTLTDPNGVVQLSGAAMTANGATTCSGTANNSDEAFEYAYTVPAGAAIGNWTATVTANEGTEGTISSTANGSFYQHELPSLLVIKSVSVVSDPAEGTTRPKSIPGAVMLYTVQVQNSGSGAADSGSLVITDPVPTNTVFDLTGATPFTFTDGSPSSGLSAPVMTFSSAVGGGAPYTYSPTCSRPCTDPAITGFQLKFTGSMNPQTGATATSFTITYEVVLQ